MGPKSTKKGATPARPNRPGTPLGPASEKDGGQGRTTPPPGGTAGKKAKGYGGKPGAGAPGKPADPATGGGGRSRFQAPPHIGAPRGGKQPKQSGYGKFGPPEGTGGIPGAPRVTRPGGSRPVLNNRRAVPAPGSLTPRGTGVPPSLKPPAKRGKVKPDPRGVIRPSDKDPNAEISPLTRDGRRQRERLQDPLTRRYLDEFHRVAGLPPVTPLAPPAPPKRHTPGPAIGF
jgi:hypothetical protein